jgi:alkylation response protein AidB-like acyl-CoA dehydrogenase
MIYVMHVASSKSIEASALSDANSLLKDIAAGKHLTTLGASEKGSRSLFWMPVSKLVTHGDGYRVSAEKSWVTAAHHVQSFVATAQSPDAESPLQSECFLVRTDRDGIDSSRAFDGLGLRGNDSAPVYLTDYRVAPGDMITSDAKGFEHLLGVVLPWFLVGTTALSIGLMKAATSITQEHLLKSSFEHDGSRLADLGNLRARLAQMNTTASAAAGLLETAIAALEGNDPAATLHLLQARLFAIENVVRVADQAMQTCGGAAFSKHSPLERVFRDSLTGRVMAPTTDHLHDLIGKALLGMELFE